MTKRELAQRVWSRFDGRLTLVQSSSLVESVLTLAMEGLLIEGELKIAGFGSFNVRDKNDRRGRNPQTGDPITIASRKVVRFKPSLLLKARVAQDATTAP